MNKTCYNSISLDKAKSLHKNNTNSPNENKNSTFLTPKQTTIFFNQINFFNYEID